MRAQMPEASQSMYHQISHFLAHAVRNNISHSGVKAVAEMFDRWVQLRAELKDLEYNINTAINQVEHDENRKTVKVAR